MTVTRDYSPLKQIRADLFESPDGVWRLEHTLPKRLSPSGKAIYTIRKDGKHIKTVATATEALAFIRGWTPDRGQPQP